MEDSNVRLHDGSTRLNRHPDNADSPIGKPFWSRRLDKDGSYVDV